MMLLFGSMWQKLAGYVIVVVGTLAALGVAYGRGRRAMRDEVRRRVLGQDLENRRVGEAVRDSIGRDTDVDAGLRRWRRNGS